MNLRQHLSNKYGGTYSFGRYFWHSLLDAANAYRCVPTPELCTFERLVFVCKGNICRSPYAEARARQLGMRTVSAGLDTTPGKGTDLTARAVAMRRGVDLTAHCTQRLTELSITQRDLILVMEPDQLKLVSQQTGIAVASLLGLYAIPRRAYLQDPFGRSITYFESCYDVIDSALARLQPQLTSCRI
jgi:protein-tyrosine phosphatase